MRNISVQEFEQHPADYVAQVEAGARLTLLRGGKAVATLAPTVQFPLPEGPEREAARQHLLQTMHKGLDLGGLRINRDELYDDAI